MSHLILVDESILFCSKVCFEGYYRTNSSNPPTKEVTSIREYARLNWEWTEEDGQGSLYGELCPVCECDYQDALDPCGVLERY